MAEPYRDRVDAVVDRAQAVEAEIKDLLRRREWNDVQLEVRVVVSGPEEDKRPLAAEIRVPESEGRRPAAPLDRLIASAAAFAAAIPAAARLGMATATGGLIGGLVVLAALQGALFAESRDADRDIFLVHTEPTEEVRVPLPVAPAPASREIWVESTPDGAEVYIDGQATGLTTPAQIFLAPDRQMVWVRVERAGYEAEERQVDASVGAAVFHLRHSPVPGEPPLPERLDRAQVQAGMRGVATAASRCGRGQAGRVTVDVVISGNTGRVTWATVTGPFAGTPTGACVARAVRRAEFSRFSDETLTVRGYPFVLR
jgi:hypothetical protein